MPAPLTELIPAVARRTAVNRTPLARRVLRDVWHDAEPPHLEIKPVAYWLQNALSLNAEALLSLQETEGTPAASPVRRLADEAVDTLCRFARQLPLARPHAHLWRGLTLWLAGKEQRAMREWQEAASLGNRLGLRYEVARAHFEIGRHLPEGESRASHLREAQEEFERLGSAAELERIRELSKGRQ
jgi:hypothetical protein